MNIITDPFNLKGNPNPAYFDFTKNPNPDYILEIIPKRDYVYTCINLTKNIKYDYLLISGSSGASPINTQYFIKKYGNIAVITLNKTSANEQLCLLKHFLKLHPETKNVIVSLEFNTYIKCYNHYTIPRKPSNALTDFLKLNFSLDATKGSIKKIFSNIKEKIEKVNHEEINHEEVNPEEINQVNINPPKRLIYTVNDRRRYTYDETCEYDNFETLKKIHNLIKEKQLNGIYFIPPVNALYLADVYSQGIYDDVEAWKKMVTQIVPYYDMAYVNKYTTMPLGFYFRDVIHANRYAFTLKILNSIIDKSNSEKDFATYVTKENVNEILKEQRTSLIEYMSKNEKQINSYIKDVYNGSFDNVYEYPLYESDLTENELKLLIINQ